MSTEQDQSAADSGATTKADAALVLVWWFWLAPALMVLALPIQYFSAVCARGWEGVATTGIGNGGFAIIGVTGVLAIYGFLPWLFLSLLYAFLFWRRKRRGAALSARSWIPIYGSMLIVAAWALTMIQVLPNARREQMPSSDQPEIGR